MLRILFLLGLTSLALGQSDWQTYVNRDLVGAGLTSGVIIGLNGAVWASAGLSIRNGEGAALASLFKNPSNAYSKGITIAGITYLAVKANPESIYGKKGTGGVITAKTEQTIIIGVYGGNLQPGNAANIVEKLAGTFRQNGN